MQYMTPPSFCAQCVTLKSTHSDTGTAPQLLPTALPPCSWCHYSRTERRRSRRSLLREADGRKETGENKQTKKRILDNVNSCSLQWWGEKREEHAHRNICPNYQSFICTTRQFIKNIWEIICEECKSTSSWVCQVLCMYDYVCVPAHACVCANAHIWWKCLLYHRPSGFPLKSLSWVNTSCCPQKGRCLNDRWRGCQDKKKHTYCKESFIFRSLSK